MATQLTNQGFTLFQTRLGHTKCPSKTTDSRCIWESLTSNTTGALQKKKKRSISLQGNSNTILMLSVFNTSTRSHHKSGNNEECKALPNEIEMKSEEKNHRIVTDLVEHNTGSSAGFDFAESLRPTSSGKDFVRLPFLSLPLFYFLYVSIFIILWDFSIP